MTINEDPVDEFNMDEPPPLIATKDDDLHPEVHTAKGKSGVPKLNWWRDWYAIAAVGVVGAVWLFWPHHVRQANAPASQSPVLDPQSAMREAAQQPEQIVGSQAPVQLDPQSDAAATKAHPSELAATSAETVDTTAADADVSHAAWANAALPTVVPPRHGAPEEALEGRIASNEARLNDVLASLKQIKDRLDVLSNRPPPPGNAVHAKAPSKYDGPRISVATGIKKLKEPTIVRALSGEPYTINTIGRDVAWIQAGDHLEVVAPGDRVGHVRVLAIDPIQHRITTSDGVIR